MRNRRNSGSPRIFDNTKKSASEKHTLTNARRMWNVNSIQPLRSSPGPPMRNRRNSGSPRIFDNTKKSAPEKHTLTNARGMGRVRAFTRMSRLSGRFLLGRGGSLIQVVHFGKKMYGSFLLANFHSTEVAL